MGESAVLKTGICGLCEGVGIIKKSHLLPKSAYKYLRDLDFDGGSSPLRIDMAMARFGKTDKQVCAYFLCGACEGRFSKLGESLVSKIWAGRSKFLMHDILSDIDPQFISASRLLYSADQISEEISSSLYYFAVSVLWRAVEWPQRLTGVSQCKTVVSDALLKVLAGFLTGSVNRLDDVFVVVDVNSNRELNDFISFPAPTAHKDCKAVQFDILGLRFIMFLGPDLPSEIQRIRAEYHRSLVLSCSDHLQSKNVKMIASFFNEHNVK
ncbi:hypothetical protein HUS85_27550 [Pseudomonas protegens]|uniref:hypothetical protein n=1 Tax=Pseudomonas protegens TaxID=380021 RepID=UPI001B316F58|nr:hypothetical protein [Pseudomonas protegens]MBP5119595.1 hypothetical protein [Pseudomonas protegens]QTU20653.1 hypothetical protein HUT22_21800 [Pseudomonas protegens]